MPSARADGSDVAIGLPACDHRQMGGRLVGREAELERVAGAVVCARVGASRCLLVTGEAGIGKSRLVSEALAGLDDALVLTGHAVDMSTGEIPFGVVADTLRDLVRVAGADVLLPTERESLAPLLPGAAPQVPVERVQLLSTFLDLLERLASTRLVVWVVEDLHWADSATRDLVSLAARTLPPRLLLVATVRTDDPERSAEAEASLTSYVAGLARTPGCEVLPVSRLSPAAVQRQLRGLLGSTPSAAVATRVEQLSDGIPFVVEELVAAAGRPELSTVAAVASGRLGGLAPEARRLVEAAAVGDGHLRISLLEQVLDVMPDELDVALAEALHAGVLSTDHETDAVGFRHALLREATDRELGPGARRSWHRRWAEVLEGNPGVLAADPAALAVAEHWHQARDVRRALAATAAALPAAGRICRPDEETALWTRIFTAFGRLDDAEAVAGLSLRDAYAQALIVSGAASHTVRRTCLAAVPAEQLSDAMRLIHAMTTFDHGKGEANAYVEERLVAIADAFDDSEPDLMAVNVWANTGALMTEDLARGEQMLERARVAARELGDRRSSVLVESRDSYRAQVNGDPDRAAERLHEALELLGHERWDGVFHLWGNLVWCELIRGRHEEAQQAADEALRRLTHPHLSVNVWEHLVENSTMTWILTGRWGRAREVLEESAPWWEDDVRTSNAHLQVLDLLQTGHADDTERWRTQLESPAPGGAPVTDARGVLALAASCVGDLAGMRAELAPLWGMDRMLMYDDQLWRLVQLAARAEADAAADGPRPDRAAAEAHLQIVADSAAQFRRYGPLGETWPLDLAAQLDRFHRRDARPALRAALEGWESRGPGADGAGTPLSLGGQEAMHGAAHRKANQAMAGREIAARLEAQPLLARADALAGRYALTSRERRTDDVLTEREVEVLRLVADGMTNGQIADRLFMSPKTASVHVSHILAKLGAANRTEAATVARRQGLLPD